MKSLRAVGALLAAVALAPASLPAAAGTAKLHVGEGVAERVMAEGRVRVLVSRDAVPGSAAPEGLEVVRSLDGGRLLAGWLGASGLERLGREPSARAVVLDRVVRPAGQVGTAQIGADRLLSAGLTGAGRAIGIVDTGIDNFHPDFGAGSGGPGRILDGWNFADGNDRTQDCNGHGTAVAGVAAGHQGIAPGASIVALKVFGNRDGCVAALASDVLAAVDWALERRESLGLEVLNLSLADERVRTGFCDAEDPVSARLFARARAEGLVVVAASGNAGFASSLSWPACHSDVVSVGMVYAAGQGPHAWGGDAECIDPYTGPDVVPCTSNGGPALSLLAPGVRWLAPTSGGGRFTTFSGTSAAAPAAAGALLLTRQFTSFDDPALSTDFLRLTGVPVSDGRTALATPRLDVGTALVSPSPATGPCEHVEPSGARPAAMVCRATVSALTGNVSSLAVAISLEHPRLATVRAILTGPDGTTAHLADGIRREGTVYREVFGRTVESSEPLSLFAGKPVAGTWTLRFEDDAEFLDGRVTSWALVAEPEAPRQVRLEESPTRFLPSVARNTGRFGSFFSSDVVLFNPHLEPADVTLSFLPSGAAPDQAVAVDVRLGARATRTLSDVVGNAFRSSGFGPVRIDAPAHVMVASRTKTTAPGGGTYGLFVPPLLRGAAAGLSDPPTFLAPVFRPESARVNVGLAEVSGGETNVEILVRDGRGSLKARFGLTLGPFGSRQVSDVHAAASTVPAADDLFEVRVLSGSGSVASWAIAVDNGSNDGLLVAASRPRRDAFLPAAARSPGKFGAYFRTDLKLSNPWSSPASVRFSFFPTRGAAPKEVVLSLGAFETRLFEDVLGSLLGLPEDSAGALRITALGDGPGLIASSRTYTEEPGRSYGLAIGLLGDSEAEPGDEAALTFLSGGAGTRTNLGFLETRGLETVTEVTLFDASGSILATRELTLEPFQALQWNDVFAEMGIAPVGEASATVSVARGGALIVHATRVDNATNDGSFLPARVVRSLPVTPASVR
ncbi:MAG: S8 family serine peptidase [Thermoanaerobaculia bacterium]